MRGRFGLGEHLAIPRAAACVALLALTAGAQAQEVLDHLAHNGFEACWSKAVDSTTLASLLVTAVDGAPGCIPASSDSCYTSTCAGGVPGCPTTLHGVQAAFAPGTTRFDATARIDSISGKIRIQGVECDMTIDTSNLVLSYQVVYGDFFGDGNSGSYPGSFYIFGLDSFGLAHGDVTLSGSTLCIAANATLVPSTLQFDALEPSIVAALRPTLDVAWCPVPF
ncbi:MAG TPA: hypothetical protein VFG73_05380 [Rhodanobacteraceae bacterium]|nr:hypothetical protein [Rhodanobacteraceae bacterium]